MCGYVEICQNVMKKFGTSYLVIEKLMNYTEGIMSFATIEQIYVDVHVGTRLRSCRSIVLPRWNAGLWKLVKATMTFYVTWLFVRREECRTTAAEDQSPCHPFHAAVISDSPPDNPTRAATARLCAAARTAAPSLPPSSLRTAPRQGPYQGPRKQTDM